MKKLFTVLFIVGLVSIVACKREKKDIIVDNTDITQKVDIALTDEEKQNGILTPEILWKFGRVSDYQVNLKDSLIAYNITYYDVKANKGYTHIYTIPFSGGEVTQITSGEYSCYNPRWSQDGKTIIFLSTETDTVHLWSINTDGGEKTKISNLGFSINSFKLSPLGDKIMFIADVKLDKTPQELYPDLPNSNVIIADELMYRHWNAWHDYNYSHIFVADINNFDSLTNIIDIMEGERFDAPMSPYFDDSEITWSNDGKYIAYTCKKLNGRDYAISTDSDIYLYSLSDKSTKNLSKGMLGYDRYPVFSANSKSIAWASMMTAGYESDKENIITFDLETGTKNNITEKFDYSVSNISWDKEDNDYINFISCIAGTHQIFTIDIATKQIKQLTSGVHDYQSFYDLGESFIAQKMSMSMASEIFKVDKIGKETQITYTNKDIYDNIEFGKVNEKWVTTTDNKKMLVWEILPPKFDATKQYPAILYCQGGPQSAVSQFFSYRWNFQMMAANGYVVIAPNRRGVPGFGTEWNAQISCDYGGQNMKDYISAVNELKKAPYIDAERIGAVGASYGGFSVFWLAGHNKDKLFKAFISHCGMFNLESQYAATEETFFTNHDLGGPYWEKNNKKAQQSYSSSPHNFVQNWNTPILIIAGANDFRIPYTESLQAFNAAQLQGIESRLLIFPQETHFVLKPQNSILWQREFKNWLDKHLK